MTLVRLLAAVLAAGLLAPVTRAQSPGIPIRSVTPVEARSTDSLGILVGVREIANGKLLLNDGRSRRLLILGQDLNVESVLLDSASGAANSYGTGASVIIPYLADSTLFVEIATQSLLVIDPAGQIARVMAAPKPTDLIYIRTGAARTDPQGRLVYRGLRRPPPRPFAPGELPPAAPDSAPILRADFETRQVDTIGMMKVATPGRMTSGAITGPNPVLTMRVTPLAWQDEWTMHPDGSIAIVRGHDYHVDWIAPDGSTTSNAKMPYDWKRLTDDDKTRLLDSLRVLYDSIAARTTPGVMSTPDGGRVSLRVNYEFPPINELPDYYPPVRAGAVNPDADGNLWILPFTSAQGPEKGIVYDVVNRRGELFERVRLPEGRSLAGFGKDGAVYLMSVRPDHAWVLERVRVMRD